MNRVVLTGVAAGLLVMGFIFSPVFSGQGLMPAANADHPGGETRKYTLVANEVVLQVAPDNALHPGGIMYNAMVFNGTIPGPVVTANVGDTLELTLVNEGKTIHSADFHAGFGVADALSGNVKPGESKTWTLKAETAGAFLYHCGADGLNGVWEHIANGMYGGAVIHPVAEKPAKEFYMSFGEIYNSADKGPFAGTEGQTGSFDLTKLWNDTPDLVLTNGMAHKYVPAVGTENQLPLNPDLLAEMQAGNLTNFIKVKPGELTRWYIVNPGPNQPVAFHFIGGQMDVKDGSVREGKFLGRQLSMDETWTIPPGSATVIEAVFPQEGIYVGVDHNMSHVLKGGAFAVVATNDATEDDHPPGTWVPSKSDLKEGTMMEQ